MRLIDAEHLKWNVGGIKCGTLTVAYLNWILEHEEPTVDAEPVRHGRWNFEGWDTYTCSSCSAVYGTEQLTALQQYNTDPVFPRYCPNCGAKMDGEK